MPRLLPMPCFTLFKVGSTDPELLRDDDRFYFPLFTSRESADLFYARLTLTCEVDQIPSHLSLLDLLQRAKSFAETAELPIAVALDPIDERLEMQILDIDGLISDVTSAILRDGSH